MCLPYIKSSDLIGLKEKKGQESEKVLSDKDKKEKSSKKE